ncbi:MAG: metal-dependent transcriptional regulator [Planctomycetaceae bacterium]|nr:metal-dependent transcriptional regulator [Planctomycetaceae bacterium]MDR1269387.1 metal-dependent transcriptional regulator [Planctomycetaceae bacterium]
MPRNMTHGNLLTAVMEDYLEAIYHIAQEHGYARSGQISRQLGVHKSTVTTAMHNLESQGFIEYAPYKEVTLTPKGVKEAEGIVRRHDIFFRLLYHLLGVEKEEASKLACEMEHALAPEIADQFISLVEKALRKNKVHEHAKDNSETKKITKKFAAKNEPQKKG